MDYLYALNNVESHDQLFVLHILTQEAWPAPLMAIIRTTDMATRLCSEDSFGALLFLGPVRSNFAPGPLVITVVVVTVSHDKGARVRMQSEALAQPLVYYLLF